MDKASFGKLIRERRKQQELTQAELAEKLHVTDKAVSKWERGESFPDIMLLEAIAEALRLSPEAFFSEKAERTAKDGREAKKEARTCRRRIPKQVWLKKVGLAAALVTFALLFSLALYVGERYHRQRGYLISATVTEMGDGYITVKASPAGPPGAIGTYHISLEGVEVELNGLHLEKGASVYVFFTFQAKLRREPVLTDGQWLSTVSRVEVYEQIKIL